ncbi:hypothetical protein Taro_033450, partial [Colocasia esculenta]|nr:hypothetical protein [Colocasia esculenta]
LPATVRGLWTVTASALPRTGRQQRVACGGDVVRGGNIPGTTFTIGSDMWKETVKIWTSEHWVWRSDVNRKNKGVQKIFHCAGTQTFADIRKAEEKIQTLKQSQSSASSSQTVASKYDIYSQVFGEDKPGRVRGLGTGPTPATLWGKTSDILKDENKKLGDRVKDLEERITKLERTDSKFQVQLDLKSQVGDHD